MKSGDDIYLLTSRCASLFSDCQSIPALTKDDWIGERLADFNLWAAGIRASTTGPSSLDHRVRDRSDVKHVLMGILSTLKEAAERCLHKQASPDAHSTSPSSLKPSAQNDNPWSDFSDDSPDEVADRPNKPEGPFASQMAEISMALGQLYRVTILIQRSGKKYRFRRADRELPGVVNNEEYVQLREHLQFMILLGQAEINTESWASKEYEALSDQLRRASELTNVHKALIQANIIRRNRIRFATRHLRQQEKTASPKELTEPKEKTQATTEPSTTEPDQSAGLKQTTTAERDADSKEHAVADIPDQLTPDAPQPVRPPPTSTEIGTMFMRGPRTVKGQGTAITRVTRIGAKQDYPRCPKERGMFSCRYCAQTLSADYTDASRWRGHVKQDLMPYTCVFENCKTPEDLFESSEEWMTHLTTEHSESRWVCNLCPTGSGPDDEVFFDSSQAWKDHIADAHANTFPDNQLEDLASMSEQTLLLPMPCPLCLHFDPTEAEPYDHIANHLHEFALRALPWDSNGNGGSYLDSVDSSDLEGARAVGVGNSIGHDDDDDDNWDQPPENKLNVLRQVVDHILKQSKEVLLMENVTGGYRQSLEQVSDLLSRIWTWTAHLQPLPDDMKHNEKGIMKGEVNIDVSPGGKLNEKLDEYLRPLLRIQENVRCFADQANLVTDNEAVQAKESLQDEWATLHSLLAQEESRPSLEKPPEAQLEANTAKVRVIEHSNFIEEYSLSHFQKENPQLMNDIYDSFYKVLVSSRNFPVVDGTLQEPRGHQRELLGKGNEALAKLIWTQKDTITTQKTTKVLGAEDIRNLGAQSDLTAGDCQRILRSVQQRHGETRQLLSLLNHRKFRDFFESDNSSVLLIKDNSRRGQANRLALSFTAAMVVKRLRDNISPSGGEYVLAFFCNMPGGSEKMHDGKAVMTQLVSQLMLQYQDLSEAILGDDFRSLEGASTTRLLRLFSHLLQQLPSDALVYCIIDSFHPSSMKGKSTSGVKILSCLLETANRVNGQGPVVKVLLTTSSSKPGFRNYFDCQNVIDVALLRRSAPQSPGRLGQGQINNTALGKLLY